MSRFTHQLTFFRILFPRWSFFENIGTHLTIEYQVQTAQHTSSQYSTEYWQNFEISTSSLTKGSLFFNPTHNLKFSIYNIIEHFALDLQTYTQNLNSSSKKINQLAKAELSDWLKTNSNFLMISSLIHLDVIKKNNGRSNETLIFKIKLSDQNKEEYLITDWMTHEF